MAKATLKKTDYPSNSINEKLERTVKKVATGKVLTREKPFLMRFFGENFSSIGEYILYDVLLPAAKSTFSDIISNGIEMMLYGEPSRRSGLKREKGRSYVSYNSLYDRRASSRRSAPVSRPQSRHSFNDVILESRMDGEEVLSSLLELIDTYELATVADFYSAVGLEGEWSDNKFGWDNLSTAEVKRIREGYVLVLPKPVELD